MPGGRRRTGLVLGATLIGIGVLLRSLIDEDAGTLVIVLGVASLVFAATSGDDGGTGDGTFASGNDSAA